jgi:hypothetical protein
MRENTNNQGMLEGPAWKKQEMHGLILYSPTVGDGIASMIIDWLKHCDRCNFESYV